MPLSWASCASRAMFQPASSPVVPNPRAPGPRSAISSAYDSASIVSKGCRISRTGIETKRHSVKALMSVNNRTQHYFRAATT